MCLVSLVWVYILVVRWCRGGVLWLERVLNFEYERKCGLYLRWWVRVKSVGFLGSMWMWELK